MNRVDFILSLRFKNDKINDKINPLDKEILVNIKDNKYITIPELAKITNKSEITVYRHLDSLMNQSMIKGIGSRKNGYLEIL